MKFLITGAGLVGCHVAQKLLEVGDEPVLFEMAPRLDYVESLVPPNKVRVVIGDILDLADLIRVIEGEGVDYLVHTAFMLTAASKERPHAGIAVNVSGTSNVLEAARLAGIKRVVFCSSSSVYTRASIKDIGSPYSEDMAFKTVSQRPTTIYAATKLACEYLGLVYNDRYGLDFVALRIAGIFGPFKGPKGSGGLNTVLIREIIDAGLSQEVITLSRPPGWPSPREFVYAKDVADAIVKCCYAGELDTKVYNIGMGKFYDFPDVVRIANKVFPGSKIKLRPDGDNKPLPDDEGWYYKLFQPFDISLAEKELGFSPQYDMDRALADFGHWRRINSEKEK